ncbi:MAG: hypothetical protein KGL74_00765, partial [Elusimicrobia bacterium]|nr:hypothetical protein [Elusimicrobiota bacterium]
KACMSRVAAECGTAPAPKSSAPAAPALPALDPAVKSACAVLWADPDPTTGAPGSEKKPSVVGDVPPATACGGGVANPGAVAGTDKDCTPAAKKPDPNFYRNVANGMAFGMFGLILGSFFGGPLVMLAGAAILGGGAFALSRHLNKPKDGK